MPRKVKARKTHTKKGGDISTNTEKTAIEPPDADATKTAADDAKENTTTTETPVADAPKTPDAAATTPLFMLSGLNPLTWFSKPEQPEQPKTGGKKSRRRGSKKSRKSQKQKSKK
jgi:hypothetical protein